MVFSLAPGKSLEAAANQTVSDNQLRVINRRQERVNGFNAISMLSETETLRVRSFLIQYNNRIYKFHGLAEKVNFNRFEADFLRTMTNFARLTDPAKINVQPDRLRIKRLSKPMTLSQALRQFKIPNDRHSEHAILNSLRLQDQLEGGTLIKIIGK